MGGTYDVALEATDQYGQPVDATARTITVDALAPTATWQAQRPGNARHDGDDRGLVLRAGVASAADVQAGFHYLFGCTTGAENSNVPSGTTSLSQYEETAGDTSPSQSFTIPASEGYVIWGEVIDAEGLSRSKAPAIPRRRTTMKRCTAANGQRPSVQSIDVNSSSGSDSSPPIVTIGAKGVKTADISVVASAHGDTGPLDYVWEGVPLSGGATTVGFDSRDSETTATFGTRAAIASP